MIIKLKHVSITITILTAFYQQLKTPNSQTIEQIRSTERLVFDAFIRSFRNNDALYLENLETNPQNGIKLNLLTTATNRQSLLIQESNTDTIILLFSDKEYNPKMSLEILTSRILLYMNHRKVQQAQILAYKAGYLWGKKAIKHLEKLAKPPTNKQNPIKEIAKKILNNEYDNAIDIWKAVAELWHQSQNKEDKKTAQRILTIIKC